MAKMAKWNVHQENLLQMCVSNGNTLHSKVFRLWIKIPRDAGE